MTDKPDNAGRYRQRPVLSSGDLKASAAMPAVPLRKLRVRRDFLRVAGSGKKVAMPGLVLQAAHRHPTWCKNRDLQHKGQDIRDTRPPRQPIAEIGVGFTASKKVGNAVERNRAKRRLREIARMILPHYALPGMDYVLIARRQTGSRPFKALEADLMRALGKLSLKRDA